MAESDYYFSPGLFFSLPCYMYDLLIEHTNDVTNTFLVALKMSKTSGSSRSLKKPKKVDPLHTKEEDD